MPMDEGARKLWALFARGLLTEKYGVDLRELHQEEWNALYWTLGTLAITDVRGSMTMLVFEATAWCGLAATRFAPHLWNRYYLALSILLTLAGLLPDWHVVGGLNNPRFLGYLKIRSLVREFHKAKVYGEQLKKGKSSHGSDEDSASELDEA